MEFEVSYSLENEEEFWAELDDILSADCPAHEQIDNALRSYLSFTKGFKEEYLQTEDDIEQCVRKLFEAPLFTAHKAYVRRQFIYSLIQEDDPATLHLVAAFLLFDGTDDDDRDTFKMMETEGAFSRLVELIKKLDGDDHRELHRMLLQLLYEMGRIQRLTYADLSAIDDTFVLYLFQVVEELFNDPNDPYCYHVIRVLLVLNEQYFVANIPPPPVPLTNRVIKALSTHGHIYKTFGENLILLLNREVETSLTLLILKLLYLLFLTDKTADYFYTNDLHVLIDIIIRNLLDLPSDSISANAVRHTYLRVLHPLLANSQVNQPPHYKPSELLRVLNSLSESNDNPWRHFDSRDETTIRLAKRCADVAWLKPRQSGIASPDADAGRESPSTDSGHKTVAQRMLGMSVPSAGDSALSVVEVATHTEKPGVLTPSKERGDQG
ncbi:uncharacterized protein K452DRAFT_266133 [Aplosporella prunicola CBS 121167]|uniref:SPIN90/Ldb17 leucine-rich domain-containing protein n=1 Tax=Aplosporella prunicola CBS 121167 TaxID=1176127 RepID=A0A6A6BK18_9PEZI|nr:uncharacterized protein K452DRAFT_266133 [Aplosporella prunicola CBS 121167]KAF2144376.1 hypothetical protein K452DRAFT_266133 [Aplosporella prunicola CBS 121167]